MKKIALISAAVTLGQPTGSRSTPKMGCTGSTKGGKTSAKNESAFAAVRQVLSYNTDCLEDGSFVTVLRLSAFILLASFDARLVQNFRLKIPTAES